MSSCDVFYYYLRDEGNHPYGCVAIQRMASSDRICRGVSLCSKRDRFDRRRARGIALNRLNMAFESMFGEPFGSYHGKNPTCPADGNGFGKYDCGVEPTEYERRILEGAE